MKLIFLKDNASKPKTLSISKTLIAGIAISFMLLSSAVFVLGAYMAEVDHALVKHYKRIAPYQLEKEIAKERQKLTDLKADLKNNLAGLSSRLGGLQAQVSRINAVEKRLARVANIDIEAYDFSNEPAQGGSDSISVDFDVNSLSNDILQMEDKLSEREAAIESLGVSLSEMVLKEGQTPEGMPVRKGWISSGFGWRASPFTGKKQFHKGVDFPARHGADVIAVADGIVVRSERERAFGNVVEINHGDGLRTLYAHNSKNVVTVGQSISKGDKIAEAGSTGRSTGPHVHFQVYKDGKAVDPNPYIK